MGRIRILGDDVINRIAAGEVVQRPASALKELLENSLDAGARRVDIAIEGGGAESVRVEDDGEGMDEEDLLLAVERHATSKVEDDDEVFGARTLGFRGEALPSIAAVSSLDLETCADLDRGGTRLTSVAGVIRDVSPCVRARGTTVTVRRLFHNTPARRKFLKGPAVEAAHCREVVVSTLLAHPDVAFTYRVDGRPVLTSAGDGKVENAVLRVFGGTDGAQMVTLEERRHPTLPLSVSGSVSTGLASRSSAGGIVLVVNGRVFRSHAINRLLQELYSPYLAPRRWPLAVLFITADPRIVDVNVHPAKLEVRFSFFDKLRSFLSSAVGDSLRRSVPAPMRLTSEEAAEAATSPPLLFSPSSSVRTETPALVRDPAATASLARCMPGEADAIRRPPRQSSPSSSSSLSSPSPSPPDLGLTVLGQVLDTYIVAASADGLVLVDQHAAHERMLYEQVLKRSAGPDRIQRLLFPRRVAVPADVAALVASVSADLAGAGLELTVEDDAVVVHTLPALYEGQDPEALVNDLVAGFTDLSGEDPGEVLRTATAAMVACKAAVKAGQPLTRGEMERLLRDLALCDQPTRCPHGRPTVVELTAAQLEQGFGRR